jgi:Mor family transcriptional regulator
MTKNYEGRLSASDMVAACSDVTDRAAAVKAIRAVCKYFGGQIVYFPKSKITGKTTEELHGVLRDAVGDYHGGLMLERLMALYGGGPIYIPMEKGAFRKDIAQEIYERYDGNDETIRDLCREYNMSFVQVYRLYYEGRDNKLQTEFEF